MKRDDRPTNEYSRMTGLDAEAAYKRAQESFKRGAAAGARASRKKAPLVSRVGLK